MDRWVGREPIREWNSGPLDSWLAALTTTLGHSFKASCGRVDSQSPVVVAEGPGGPSLDALLGIQCPALSPHFLQARHLLLLLRLDGLTIRGRGSFLR